MKHRLIWLQGGSVSHRWTIPLIGQSSEHNFRRVERDISCLCKLFQGILVLYIKSKRLASQEILSQSAQWQWAVLQQLNVQRLFCLLHPHTSHFVAIKQLIVNSTVVHEMFSSSLFFLLELCGAFFLKNWEVSVLLCFLTWISIRCRVHYFSKRYIKCSEMYVLSSNWFLHVGRPISRRYNGLRLHSIA